MHKVQICTILIFSCANRIPHLRRKSGDCTDYAPTLALFVCTYNLPFVLCSQASELFASEGSCMFLVRIRAKCTFAVSRNQRATTSRFTKFTHAYLQLGVTRSSLAFGKLSASLRRQNNGTEIACVNARLLWEARHADLRLVPGSLRGASLRKKICGWCKSTLCT